MPYYYKTNSNGDQMAANMLYSPIMVSDETLCMHFCKDPNYRSVNEVSEEVITFFFQRELLFLRELNYFNFTPKIIDVNNSERKIYIEWNKETLSQIVNDPNRSIDDEIPDWKEQLHTIVKELNDAGYYKMALYPHCFFVKDGIIKTMDYYSIISKEERYLDRNLLEGFIGKEGAYRFNESTVDGKIDFKKFFNITMTKHLENYWPDNPFPVWYNELYND